MLIKNAELYTPSGWRKGVDLRTRAGCIAAVGNLNPETSERVVDAQGGALLPGLHDHHIHLFAYAAARQSIVCGPPEIFTAEQLSNTLAQAPGNLWLRGYGYHESVAGDIDVAWLDANGPARPVRIQHRTGRCWILNTMAIAAVQAAAQYQKVNCPPHSNGRFYDEDVALRGLWPATEPDIQAASQHLAQHGITGITDMTPSNGLQAVQTFAALQNQGQLLQKVYLAGLPELSAQPDSSWLTVGPTKLHLHESKLPDFDDLCAIMAQSFLDQRAVAVHCVTEAELVFALAALRNSKAHTFQHLGNRIEHASLTPPALLHQIQELGLTVVTQPNFIAERGDAYHRDIPAAEHDWLYRCRSFLDCGIPLAAGSDAPFGDPNPWRAMAAAVHRTTAQGNRLGTQERLSVEQALALFMGHPSTPSQPQTVTVGAAADLVLLTTPWHQAKQQLDHVKVHWTMNQGQLIYQRID